MTNSQNNNSDNFPESKPASHNKKPNAKRIIIIILCVILAIVIIFIAAFYIMSAIGHHSLHSGDKQISVPTDIDTSTDDKGIIEYNGEKYKYNENIISVLFLGVDKNDITENSDYGKNGQADSLFVACLDTKTGGIKIIPISRETAVDVNLYSTNGEYAGIQNEQVCLAYSYGNTTEKSCENVLKSVSRILYGMNIGSYTAIDLNGVSTMTNMIGGITVTSPETIGSFTEGKQVTLKGKLAVEYIQNRGQDLEANNRRMQRQKQFLAAFASKAGNEILSNFTKLGTYYSKAMPYINTNLGLAEITYLVNCCLTTDVGSSLEYISIEGTSSVVDSHVLFTPDRNSSYQAVLNAFYTKVEK